jgi:hypothetical protein
MLGGEGRLGHVENHAKLVSAEESGAENDHVPSHFETGWLRWHTRIGKLFLYGKQGGDSETVLSLRSLWPQHTDHLLHTDNMKSITIIVSMSIIRSTL